MQCRRGFWPADETKNKNNNKDGFQLNGLEVKQSDWLVRRAYFAEGWDFAKPLLREKPRCVAACFAPYFALVSCATGTALKRRA